MENSGSSFLWPDWFACLICFIGCRINLVQQNPGAGKIIKYKEAKKPDSLLKKKKKSITTEAEEQNA